MNVNKPKRPSKYYIEKMVELLLEKRKSALIPPLPTIYCNKENADILNKVLIVDYISKIK